VEHSAITNTIKQLSELQGFAHSIVPVDAHGMVSVEALQDAITPQTALVSLCLRQQRGLEASIPFRH
jgi:cysteine desulfurase